MQRQLCENKVARLGEIELAVANIMNERFDDFLTSVYRAIEMKTDHKLPLDEQHFALSQVAQMTVDLLYQITANCNKEQAMQDLEYERWKKDFFKVLLNRTGMNHLMLVEGH